MQHVELELDRINILIGPQAVGKSVCAKLLYYFKRFPDAIYGSAEKQQSKTELDRELRARFESYFPPSTWPTGSFRILYGIGDASIEVLRDKSGGLDWQLSYPDYLLQELENTRGDTEALIGRAEDSLAQAHARSQAIASLQDRIHAGLGDTAGFSPMFVPAGRSFFAYLESNIFTFLSTGNAVDPFLLEFGRQYESLRRFRLDTWPQDETWARIEPMLQDILRGRFYQEEGRDFLEASDGRRVPIASSSSGQQEMLPLAIILGLLSLAALGKVGSSVFIEEPEAHLFPTAQRRVVELLATVFNSAPLPVQFTITTHSPYILTAFNNLLQAGYLSKQLTGAKREELEKIVPPKQFLDPGVLRAYSLANGTAERIPCDDSGIMTTNLIDDVSHELSVQFGQLLDLE
jgi:hypothetical protein